MTNSKMKTKNQIRRIALIALTGFILTSKSFAQNAIDYSQFDFVPGEKIIFEDNFKDEKENAAPAKWRMLGGQVAIVKQGDERLVSILQYYTSLAPKLKPGLVLPLNYTLEFDYYLDAGYEGNPGVFVSFRNAANEEIANIVPNKLNTSFGKPGVDNVIGENPSDILNEAFFNKWHHIAIWYGSNQLKVYINQHKVLEVSQANFKATALVMSGNSSQNMPMYFKNFKLAESDNQLAKALAQGKVVTHAIRFDLNKAEVRGESMGFIKQVADYLKANTTVKFEVGGHTDSDGDDQSNQILSEQRAVAVKDILVGMGVSFDQLVAIGYGETQPISPNTTPDGRANNRRVEFVKK